MAFFFKQPGPSPRDIRDMNRMRQQQSAQQQQEARRYQRRRALGEELKAAHARARRVHEDLLRIMHEVEHMKHEHEHSMDGAEQLDAFVLKLSDYGNGATFTQHPGGIEGVETAFFQLATMCILLLQRVTHMARDRQTREKARRHGEELKGTFDRLRSKARSG